MIIQNTQGLYRLGETIVVDETMVPFRGRLSFRQYNPSKASRYGIKLYKVCTPEGFTWNLSVYDGKSEKLGDLYIPGSTVINLTQDLLNEDRLIITDNYYTSIGLAKHLYQQNTNLIGTVRKNRKGLDNSTLEAKLQKGEICSVQQQYMTFMKWRDQRDVLMISTCFGDGSVETGKDRRGNTKTKPKIIVEYNKGKQGVDISDQLSSYYTSLRKSLVWYKKIAIGILCSTTVVNSHILYQTIVEKNMSLLQFTESVIRALLPSKNNSPEVAVILNV
ncbi:hypothetical protein NQ314_013108 [Rhamnusium bicolor]|uniref:PiggyBac transposable element-derived protein domain-containing protein n=1 Tax=Rhamnusium bicolor TaxID=1586634 RepID=A0AAV8X7M0_9CUCU|nr:hypothetical protein NQ314_013108 [Rhamnusium bicolor]